MKKLRLLLTLIIVFIAASTYAQLPKGIANKTKVSSDDEFTLNQAERYYTDGDFNNALPLYQELLQKYSEEPAFAYRAAVCLILNKNQAPQAIPILEKLIQKKASLKDLDYFLGRAYQYNFDFDRAKRHFERFVNQDQKDEKMKIAQKYILQCQHGKEIISNPVVATIKNLSDTINTVYEEYAPVLDTKENILFYTFKGDSLAINNQNEQISVNPDFDYFEDVYTVTKTAWGGWSRPVRLGEPFNFRKETHHDATVSISEDGKKMFLYKDKTEGKEGDLYMLEKVDEKWQNLKPLTSINTTNWEGSASLSIDNKKLIFSSDRPGGIGQRDLYSATVLTDGSYGDVKNLGSQINSEFNEDAPCFSHDGKYLYFSSEGHNSIGNYDIFKSEILSDGSFGKPENLGFPINSIDDDIYFSISHDKTFGFLSSDRAGGFGDMDLYMLKLEKEIKRTHLLTLKGTVTSAGKPVGGDILVYDDKDELMGKYQSSLADGAYKIILLGGKNYKLNFDAKNYLERTESVTALKLDSNQTRTLNIELAEAAVISIAERSEQIAKEEKAKEDARIAKEKELALAKTEAEKLTLAKAEAEKKATAEKELALAKEKESGKENQKEKQVTENKDLALAKEKETKLTEDKHTPEKESIKEEKKVVEKGKMAEAIKKSEQIKTTKTSEDKNDKLTKDSAGADEKQKEAIAEVLTLSNIYFDFNTTVVKQSAFESLNKLASSLVKNKANTIEIIGHADSKGDDNYNLKLSKKRAMSVANYLAVRGVSRSRIKITAIGETMPIAPNQNVDGSDNPEGRGKNRRVELKLFDKLKQLISTSN